jgi:hypothetical protein
MGSRRTFVLHRLYYSVSDAAGAEMVPVFVAGIGDPGYIWLTGIKEQAR